MATWGGATDLATGGRLGLVVVVVVFVELDYFLALFEGAEDFAVGACALVAVLLEGPATLRGVVFDFVLGRTLGRLVVVEERAGDACATLARGGSGFFDRSHF